MTIFRVFLISLVLFITQGMSRSVSRKKRCFQLSEPEVDMNALQLIRHWGYVGEEYTVTTEDGYILRIQRIPFGREQLKTMADGKTPMSNQTARPIIFLQHGLLTSSTNWLTNVPEQAAGYVFADAGFDVWLGNFRGNTYGRQHVTLNHKQSEFWQFSWDEMAKYDLPAMINFVLNKTNQEQLYYVGHSAGTMTAFAKCSDDQNFTKKIKKLFMLAPVATLSHVKGPIKLLGKMTQQVEFLLNAFGVDEFLPKTWVTKLLAKSVCGWQSTNPICENIFFQIAGPDSNQLNQTRLPVYLSHTPAGTSSQNFVHFGQQTQTGAFQSYNYGSKKANYAKYGQDYPPYYDLTKSEVPTAIFWGDNDWLANPTDVQRSIIPKVKNLTDNCRLSGFNHLDFIWGMRAAKEIYLKIVDNILYDTPMIDIDSDSL